MDVGEQQGFVRDSYFALVSIFPKGGMKNNVLVELPGENTEEEMIKKCVCIFGSWC